MTSLGEEHNPYAAPNAELQVQSVESGPTSFYPMSPLKAAVMSVITFGLFDLVFWYRHWNRLQDNGRDVSPLFRAFFGVFTSFGFVNILAAARTERNLETSTALRAGPGVYLGLNLAARVSDKLLEGLPGLAFTLLACAGGAWVLATIQTGANEVLEADNYKGPFNSGATAAAIVAGILGLMFWFFVILGTVSPDAFGPE